jgi:hypothetical protein
MRLPDYCEALTGYRSWSIATSGLLLGCSHAAPWPPRAPMFAQCHTNAEYAGREPHLNDGQWIAAPAPHCGCGIYAYKTDEWIEEYRTVTGWTWGEPRVWGAVKLWGRIIEHQWGYRAEYAYPHELCTNDGPLAAKIATLYGVKVTCTPDEPSDRDDDDEDDDDPTVFGGGAMQSLVNQGLPAGLAGRPTLVWGGMMSGYFTLQVQSPFDPNVGAPVSLVWAPDETDRSPIHQPRHRRLIALWRRIAWAR